jgi:drug/metabolite transporter (DMT)-like permease
MVPPAAGDPVAGVIWITISMALFAGLAVFSRQAMNAGLHPFEVVFLRNACACVLLAPLLVYRGRSFLRSERVGLYGVRVAISLLSMQAWFYALSLIPIGEVTAISYLAPLFGTLDAVLLLGEVVRIRRWTALAVGFAGAMIMLRPSGSAIGVGQVCALLSAMMGGLTSVLVKQRTARDDPDRIVFLTNANAAAAVAYSSLVRVALAGAGGTAGVDRHGRVCAPGPRLRGPGLCRHRRVAGDDIRVLKTAVCGRHCLSGVR